MSEPESMCEFDITHWVDFVRGVVAPAESEKMQRHLNEGCRDCSAVVQFLQQVVAASSQVTVPEDLVRAALRVFPAEHRVAKVPSWFNLPKFVARLVYSSLEDSQPEWTPSASPSHVHLMYEAGDYTLDLHFELPTDSPNVVLVGKIADRTRSDEPMASLPVYIRTSTKTIAEGATNEFGEFSLIYRLRLSLRLSIPIAEESKTLELSLDDILSGRW